MDHLNSNLTIRYNPDTDYIQCLHNGAWINAVKAGLQILYLYNFGNHFVDISGGWYAKYGNITFQSNYISIKATNAENQNGVATHRTPINLTYYENLKVNYDFISAHSYDKVLLKLRAENGTELILSTDATGGNGKVTNIDITDYNGKYNVEVVAGAYNLNMEVKLYSIKLS